MKRRGFSLVEALVAMVLLVIALVPMAAVPAATSRLYIASAAGEQAALLALQKAEELEAKKPSELAEGSDTINGYSVVWTVKSLAGDVREIEVAVSWGGGKGRVSVTRQVSSGAPNTSS